MKGLENVNAVCKNNALELAFKQAGVKKSNKKVQWPRQKGPAGIRIDCGSGFAVSFVSKA